MSYQDRTLTCQDCGQSSRSLRKTSSITPRRATPTSPSVARVAARPAVAAAVVADGGGYGGGGGGGYGRAPREMHDAVCAQCGKQTQVPFLPRGDRPVYCSDCFQKQPASSPRRY